MKYVSRKSVFRRVLKSEKSRIKNEIVVLPSGTSKAVSLTVTTIKKQCEAPQLDKAKRLLSDPIENASVIAKVGACSSKLLPELTTVR